MLATCPLRPVLIREQSRRSGVASSAEQPGGIVGGGGRSVSSAPICLLQLARAVITHCRLFKVNDKLLPLDGR
jgi:hypothetical protein